MERSQGFGKFMDKVNQEISRLRSRWVMFFFIFVLKFKILFLEIIEYIIINNKRSTPHLDRLKGVERSQGFGKFMDRVNKRDLSARLEMGNILIYF